MPYGPPNSSAGIQLLVPAFTWNLATEQTATIPRASGSRVLVTMLRFFDASTDLTSLADGVQVNVTDSVENFSLMDAAPCLVYLDTDPGKVATIQQANSSGYYMLEDGSQLKLYLSDPITATVKVLAFGYVLPA